MDRYKFRAKAIEEMADGNQWIVDGFGVQFIELADGGFECVLYTPHGYYHVDPETVGQYTGLKDVGKTELYQSDLWQYHGVIYIVSWHHDEAKFYFRHPNAFAGDDDHIDMGWSTHGVKVGNIYDNPELLEVPHDSQ